MPRSVRVTLFAVFFATGFSALTLQTVWQRVIALHNGIDLVSFTTVVAAFLAGLGVGGLLGGVLADRLGPRRSIVAFAISNVGIAVYAWFSTALLYDLYRDVRPHLGGTLPAFGFNFVLLLVPTTLMGLSLPLLARGAVDRVDNAGTLIGRLYSVNTLGAALGATVAGWFVLGTFGFTTATRIAATLNLLAAVALVVTARRLTAGSEVADRAADEPAETSSATGARIWPWFVAYGLTGAVALGFETVFFRVVDSLMRSNSYSFPHLLSLYLVLFGLGAAAGAKVVERVQRPDRWFLWIEVGVGATAAFGIVLLTRIAPNLGGRHALVGYFAADNFNIGFSGVDTASEWARLVFAYALGPLVVLALPVFLMGAAYPFVQALVSQRLDTLGRRTGTLFAANIAGNVVGTLVVGFVLLDRLGTINTIRVLAGSLLVLGVVATVRLTDRAQRPKAIGALVIVVLLLAALPSNKQFWAFLHGVPSNQLKLNEERACVNTTKPVLEDEMLFVNASSQNAIPYDDFHVLVGLTPTLVHPQPKRALVIGLSVGSTPYSVARDDRLTSIDTVEICGGQVDLLSQMAAQGKVEPAAILDDPRMHLHEGDGRDWMLDSDEKYDVIVVDVLRPQSAYSGNLYSTEFYELVGDHLADGGIFAQWVASPRTYNSATGAFPYIEIFAVPSYSSEFLVASNQPITADRDALIDRFDSNMLPDSFTTDQQERLRTFYASADPYCARNGGSAPPVPGDAVNTDLRPRDEYFLNNDIEVPIRPRC